MVEPLRKRRADGSLYRRRANVEEELEALEDVPLPDLLARARESEERGQGIMCSEALVYVLRREARRGNADGPGVDGLISILIRRVERVLLRQISTIFDEVQRDQICREVVDRVVDGLVDPGDRADYGEVNFNDWLAHKRDDACRKERRRASRLVRLGDSVADIAEEETQAPGDRSEQKASEAPTPEEAYRLAQAEKDTRLPAQINSGKFLPEDRERIAQMVRRAGLKPNVLEAFLLRHYWGIAIESQDPDKHSLVKHFGKSEKTIRLWLGRAEQVFIKLRGESHEDERHDEGELGVRAARVPR